MEGLITLHDGNFVILGKQAKELYQKNRLLQLSSRPYPLVPVISGQDEGGVPRVEHYSQAGMESVFAEKNVPQCHSYVV